jgi:polyphosphate kinase 2 (PPK2 family)
VAERVVRRTSQGGSAWEIVDGSDERYRSLTVARILHDALAERLEQFRRRPPDGIQKLPSPVPPEINIINRLDLAHSLPAEGHKDELLRYQGQLNRLARRLQASRKSVILVFEGPDAGGKGGAIRRITDAIDARHYRVISIAAPTEEERAHPYLWRFWRHLPRLGRFTIFDRSWYGRVLVERLEGFCAPEAWRRAYGEINAFEEQLSEFGIIIVKCWLAISPDEQANRFKAREETPHKQYKITAEDWRNREKWDAYEAAACDMIERTSTEIAPWTLVEANDKRWARIKVLKTTCECLEAALGEGR